MAVNDITPIPPAPAAAVQMRERNATQPAAVFASSVPSAPPTAATAAAPLTPAQQAALLINEVLQNLNFVNPAETEPLASVTTNPLLSAIAAGQELTPEEQAALLVNETLNTLISPPEAPVDALLINETPPLLEALAVTADLTLDQQVAAQVNTTLQDLSTIAPALTQSAIVTPTATETQALTLLQAEAAVTQAVAVTTTALAEIAATAAQTVTATPALTTTTTAATVTTTEETPLTAQATAPRDPTPYAFAVYEVRDPHPAPGEPKPIAKMITPPLPPGRVRPVDRLTLKRELERRGEGGHQEATAEEPPESSGSLQERSIHQVINEANADLARSGLPLHLVLASNPSGYLLDIYNCSGKDRCRLEQEVPIDLSELTTLLDNIQHESGIIINIKT